jgi:diaminohydroxyphosphoribosylaminopyrimidine deaminase / 5-amino-6-(5-phosphoribosylamino)uracil reductase
MNETDADRRFLRDAIECSRNAPPSNGAYSVGCVIVDGRGDVAATGFSRERGAQSHAEQVAIEKATEANADLRGATLYTSLEPCSVRGSGLRSCTVRIVDSHIGRVVFAMREPPVFVDGRGAEALADAGIEVVELGDEAPAVAQINRHLLR